MAKLTGTLAVRLTDPDGLLDVIATLEHVRDDIDHRLAVLRAQTTMGNPDTLRCGQCGDDLLPSEIEGHLASEGRLLA